MSKVRNGLDSMKILQKYSVLIRVVYQIRTATVTKLLHIISYLLLFSSSIQAHHLNNLRLPSSIHPTISKSQ